jgi:hypothetical protein
VLKGKELALWPKQMQSGGSLRYSKERRLEVEWRRLDICLLWGL